MIEPELTSNNLSAIFAFHKDFVKIVFSHHFKNAKDVKHTQPTKLSKLNLFLYKLSHFITSTKIYEVAKRRNDFFQL